jgi:hypothetical protein
MDFFKFVFNNLPFIRFAAKNLVITYNLRDVRRFSRQDAQSIRRRIGQRHKLLRMSSSVNRENQCDGKNKTLPLTNKFSDVRAFTSQFRGIAGPDELQTCNQATNAPSPIDQGRSFRISLLFAIHLPSVNTNVTTRI